MSDRASAALRQALDRTLRLVVNDFFDGVPNATAQVADRLSAATVRLRVTPEAAQTVAGQAATVTTAMLLLRLGITVELDAPNVPLRRRIAPLREGGLCDALEEFGSDVMPDVSLRPAGGERPLRAVTIGSDTKLQDKRAERWWVAATPEQAAVGTSPNGMITDGAGPPFAALHASAVVVAEVFKAILRPLEAQSSDRVGFARLFRPAAPLVLRFPFAFVPDAACVTAPRLVLVSGGAVTHAALYALQWWLPASSEVVVLDRDVVDASNLNRYMLLRRSLAVTGVAKVAQLRSALDGVLAVTPVSKALAPDNGTVELLRAAHVIVGADDIPVRWLAQECGPAWLGVGATTHFDAMVTHHSPGLSCARCAHPTNDPTTGLLPSIGFVSLWAGVGVASRFAGLLAGRIPEARHQSEYAWLMRADAEEFPCRSRIDSRDHCRFCRPAFEG